MKNAESKRTVVLGASPDPTRYAYIAVQSLMRDGHEVFPVGLKKGEISGLKIQNGFPEIKRSPMG